MRVLTIYLFIISFYSNVQSQSVKNTIDGSDIWGAWLIKGTSKVWLVDSIPERARLWDYKSDELLGTFPLKANVKDINLMANGSLAYISHNKKNEYIILRHTGAQAIRKFKKNAPSYYIHPDGKYFFGSIFEGFVTYVIDGNKISNSKLNETITGYSSDFSETSSPKIILRWAKDVIQKVDIGSNGSLSASRAFDKNTLLLNDSKDEILAISESSFKYYSLPDAELKKTENRTESIEFSSAIYDSNDEAVFFSANGKIVKFDLENQKTINSTDVSAYDLYFEDRVGKTVIGFSDSERKFYVFEF